MEPERVLFVHAHPDDETLATGATIATLVDAGAFVSVLTCTRGELGEVIPAELAHLGGEELGEHRLGELRTALSVLGVTDHRVLGEPNARWEGRGPRRYLDSGMVWGSAGAEPVPSPDGRSLSAAERDALWSRLKEVAAADPDDYRRLDSRFHLSIAEVAGGLSPRAWASSPGDRSPPARRASRT